MKNIKEAALWFWNLEREKKGYIIISLYIGILVATIIFDKASQPIEVINVVHAEEIATTTPIMVEMRVSWTRKNIEDEIRSVFPEVADTMIRVAQCESGLKPSAQGQTNDHGIFQIHVPSHRKHLEGIDLTDPKENIAFARFLYDNGGLGHWSASKHCWNK